LIQELSLHSAQLHQSFYDAVKLTIFKLCSSTHSKSNLPDQLTIMPATNGTNGTPGMYLVLPPPGAAADPCIATAASSSGPSRFFEDYGVWKDAPVLIGTTKYEPLPDVKNIMITGGAGFM
jgi:hypothetical protein